MPLGDSPYDPAPTPRMLDLIRQQERAMARDYRERLERDVQRPLAWWADGEPEAAA